ncbi:MAG TPA: hypothetical protein VE869_00710, partial [Gemmatimonas sp.]|nr:hypothetical protein [Gemmatimonas sp.]
MTPRSRSVAPCLSRADSSRLARNIPRIIPCVIALVFSVTLAREVTAQIRGGPVSEGYSRYWISGGANAVVLSDINDGASRSVWKFGSDPALLVRGALEKSLDEATTIGLAVAYGKVDLTLTPLAGTQAPLDPAADLLPAQCQPGCSAQVDLWSAMLQFRSGGGPGFHTFFEGNGGVTSFRNMRTRAD